MFTELNADQEYAQAHSVYDAKNWAYTGIHDEKFMDRMHDLEISIKSQKQSFSEVDQHILLCLLNYSSTLKGSNVKIIDEIDDFFIFFKHYVDELIQAASMKSQQFFNEMKKMQGRDFFYEVLGDLVENRLVYCGFITYRTDTSRKVKTLSLYENTGSLLVHLTIELQKHYRGMIDHYQRMFPTFEDDISVEKDQEELLADVLEEIAVDDSLNKIRLDELFQYDQKIYKLIFPDGSFFYCHPQGLLDLPSIVQRKMFEVYKYYYMRRTVDTSIKKLMETIITEINMQKKSGPEFDVDNIFKMFQEGTWNKHTLLPWYYWSSVVSEKLSHQKQLKNSLAKYYQSAFLLRSFLCYRAKSIEESGEDIGQETEDVVVAPGAAPVTASEKLSDINAFLKAMHEKPDFYTFDSMCRLGYNLGIKNKYDSPENGGYTQFVEFFLQKVCNMVSKKTNMPYVRELTMDNEGQEIKYYVYSTDMAIAFLQKRDTVANGMGFHYAELFAMEEVSLHSQAELDQNVEELVRNREPLFYKLYVFYLKFIFSLLVRTKNMKELEALFVNNKADAPRSLAEILGLKYEQLIRVGEKLEEKYKQQGLEENSHVSAQEIQEIKAQETQKDHKMNEMQEAMQQSHIEKKFSLLDWIFKLLGMGKNKKSKQKKKAHQFIRGESGISEKGSWREKLGKAFNSAIDHDLEMKRNNAQAMKNLFGGGGSGAAGQGRKVPAKDLRDKAFKKAATAQSGGSKGKQQSSLSKSEILNVVQANILEGCGLTGLAMEDALERLEDEWNEVMRIASKEDLADEKEKRKRLVHKKVNELLSYAEFKLTQSSAESEIKEKAHEIAQYSEISAMVKKDDKKIYMEWYITLLMIIVMKKKLA